MKTANIVDAGWQFAELIREIEEEGVSIRIVRDGEAVAFLVPDRNDQQRAEARAEALKEMRRLLKRSLKLGAGPFGRGALCDRN